MALTDSFEDFKTVHAGKKDIEQRSFKLAAEQQVGAFASVVRNLDGMAFLKERAFDKRSDALIIFNHKDVHTLIQFRE
jgi:hypothetical protein